MLIAFFISIAFVCCIIDNLGASTMSQNTHVFCRSTLERRERWFALYGHLLKWHKWDCLTADVAFMPYEIEDCVTVTLLEWLVCFIYEIFVSLVTKHQSHIGGFSQYLHGERLINKGPCFTSHLIPIVVLLSYLSNSSFWKIFLFEKIFKL